MAISTSLPISLSTIKTELGLTGSASLLDCFANAIASGFNATYGSISSNNQQAFRGYAEPTTGNTLKITPTSVSRSSAAFNFTITVTSNTTWTVSDNASWTTFSPSSGSGNGTISVSGTANTGNSRFSTITVTTNSGSPSIARSCVIEQLSASGGNG